jgi:hypothetical protein
MVALAGGFAAISVVFGGPLASSLLLFEALATSGKFPSAMMGRILLPGLVAAGASALRAPFFGALLSALLVGSAGTNAIPLAILAAAFAWLIAMAVNPTPDPQPDVKQGPAPDSG